MPSFRDIESFIEGSYRVDVSLNYLQWHLDGYVENYGLDLNPDFQRAHVWTREQQIAFVEHVLKLGVNTIIRFNCFGWRRGKGKNMVLVDGKQRVTACLAFLNNEIPAFGYYISEYDDKPDIMCHLQFIVNDLPSRERVLEWYLEINKGNVAHTSEEIERVEVLLANEKTNNKN